MRRILGLVMLAVTLGPARAAVYYVDGQNGSDSNLGTNPQSAFRTIGKAISRSLKPGDTVEIMAGDYFEDIDPTTSGTAASPITFKSYLDQTVTLWGSEPITTPWIREPGTNLYYVSAAFPKPIMIVEEYTTPKYIEHCNAGAWYQQRVGYVGDPETGGKFGCTNSGGCAGSSLSLLNGRNGDGKLGNGIWQWHAEYDPDRIYIRPHAFGALQCPSPAGDNLPDENPTTNGSTWRRVIRELDINDKDYLTYDGLILKDMHVYLRSADNVTFQNIKSYNGGLETPSNVNPTSKSIVIRDSLLQDAFRGNGKTDGNYVRGHGFKFEGWQKQGVDTVLIERTTVRNTFDHGSLGSTRNVVIRDSQFGPGSNHGVSFDSQLSNPGEVVIENSAFYDMQDHLYPQGVNDPLLYSRTVRITNVTFAGRPLTRPFYGGGIAVQGPCGSGGGAYRFYVNNSLFWRSRAIGSSCAATFDGNYNVYYTNSWEDICEFGPGKCLGCVATMDANSLLKCEPTDAEYSSVFVSITPSNYDAHLKAGSLAIDASRMSGHPGSPSVSGVDWEGTARPEGPYPDAGADERAGAGAPDTTPPVRSNGQPTGDLPMGTTGTTLSLSSNESATCRYAVTPGVAYGSMGSAFSTTGGTAHSTVVVGLVNGQIYNYYVRCQDLAGNANSDDYRITFSVGAAGDTSPPVVSDVRSTNITWNGAAITWTTNEPADSHVEYGTTTSYGTIAASPALVTSHSVPLSNLAPNTLYHYRVHSMDAPGNVSTFSQDQTFTTQPVPTGADNDCSDGACRITCDEPSFASAVSACNARGGSCTINFNCSDTTMELALNNAADGYSLTAPNIVIDGENQGITLKYVGDDDPLICTDQSLAPEPVDVLLRFWARRSSLRNLTVHGFPDGIRIDRDGSDSSLINVRFTKICDDAVSVLDSGITGVLLEGNTFIDAQDKAVQWSYGSGTVRNNEFINTNAALLGPYVSGSRLTVEGNRMRIDSTHPGGSCSNGIRFYGDQKVTIRNNDLSCRRNIRLGGTVEAVVTGNNVHDFENQGVGILDSAKASLSNNAIVNGAGSGTTVPSGGVVLENSSAQADLGGGSLVIDGQTVTSTGGNTIKSSSPKDLRNLRTDSYRVAAKLNLWDNATVADVLAHDVEGSVDVDPLGGTMENPPPLAPANLKRTDQK